MASKVQNSMIQKKSLLELEQSGEYGSVVIANCGCNMSSILSAQHFSFGHAPPLPLQGCTAARCTCEYRGIIDRRVRERRIADSSTSGEVKKDKREADRRK